VRDFSCGLDLQRESTLAKAPDLFRYAENFMFAIYDPRVDVGMWLHLGTCPDDFGIWEDQVLITLPGDQGLLWMYSYHRTPPASRPAGSSLSFRVIEPFQRGQLRFDGVGVRTPYAEMMSNRVRDGHKELFSFEIDIDAVAPAWDNHASAAGGKDRGDMKAQAWASEHYQQLYRARGVLKLQDRTLEIDTTGVRDHSRGQRGHAPDKFGGHNLWTATFPSGNAFGMQRMWLPDGSVTLNVAFVYIDGEFHHADVLDAPHYLQRIQLGGEPLSLQLRSPRGDHHLRGETVKTIFTTFDRPWGFWFGADPEAEFGFFAPGFSRWEWNGEVAYGLTERSGLVGGPRRS
jgi:hypothetical protein